MKGVIEPQMYIWMDDNSNLVYLQTVDNFILTGIKLYFENNINYDITNQNGVVPLPLIINKNWLNIENTVEKSIFFYGDVSLPKQISENAATLFYVTDVNNSITSISDGVDENATAVSSALIVSDKPDNVIDTKYIMYRDYTDTDFGYRDVILTVSNADPTIGEIKYKFVSADGSISAEQTQQITGNNSWYGHGNTAANHWSYFHWTNVGVDALGWRWTFSADWNNELFIVETNLEIHTNFKLENNKFVISSPVAGNASLTLGNDAGDKMELLVGASVNNFILLGSLGITSVEQKKFLWNDKTKVLGWKRFCNFEMKDNTTFTNNSYLYTNNKDYLAVTISSQARYLPINYGTNFIEYVWTDADNRDSDKWVDETIEIINGSYRHKTHNLILARNAFNNIQAVIINGFQRAILTLHYHFYTLGAFIFTNRAYTLMDNSVVNLDIILCIYYGRFGLDTEDKARILTIDHGGNVYEGRDTHGPFGANGFTTLFDFVNKNGNIVIDWFTASDTIPHGWVTGDPHITTIYGLNYDFKYKGSFRMLDNNDPKNRIVINGFSDNGPRSKTDNKLDYSTHEFIRKVYVKHGNKEMLIDCGFIGERAKIIYNLGFDVTDKELEINRLGMLKTCLDCGIKWKMKFKNESDMIKHKNRTNHNVPDIVRNQLIFFVDDFEIKIQNVNINNRLPCGVSIKINNNLENKYSGIFVDRKYVLTCKLDDIINIEFIKEPENYNENELPKYEKKLKDRMNNCNEEYHF